MLEYTYMSEISNTSTAEIEKNPSAEELFAQLLELEPKPIANFVPTNAAEQKELFLSGEVRNPDHVYGKLATLDFDENRKNIREIGDKLIALDDTSEKYADVYEQFTQNYLNKTSFMELAYKVKTAETPEDKIAAKEAFMDMNVELFGAPDQATYRSLLAEKLNKIKAKELSPAGEKIREELFAIFENNDIESVSRFKPSDETVQWLHEITTSEDGLYTNMLKHVPEQASFTDEEIKSIFEKIITEEFGETLASTDADKGILWSVDVEDAQSINVKASEKRIVVPNGREVTLKIMQGLVVHEIGVHFLRSLTGESTDLLPLKLGLSDYYDTEEGLGAVMEQGRQGEYREAGADHYITAGLALYDNKDFRDIYEAKWRLAILSTTKGDPSEEDIAKAQAANYGLTMRTMRGTDELPWFKDLSYYNGAAEVWKHLESIRGDDTEFMLVLLGKANAANKAHRRILLETATV